MSNRHKVRELALQALYQMESRGEEDADSVHASVNEGPATSQAKKAAWELASGAWLQRHMADDLSGQLAPGWPPHRQPLVDRSILRLAYHELAALGTPAAVIINESIELAKTFGSERSPAFINGVLDKMARRIERGDSPDQPGTAEGDKTASGTPLGDATSPADTEPAKPADPWLADALDHARSPDSEPTNPTASTDSTPTPDRSKDPATDSPAKPITER